MKRLFLASSGLACITDFVGKDPSQVHLLFIPTAGNLDNNVWWIDKDREVLRKMNFMITELDIAQASSVQMQDQLDKNDLVYIAGGNTFYLLQQLQDTGFGDMLVRYVERGGLYAGASAGALVAGADIEPIAMIDEPNKVHGLKSTKGLGLVPIVLIPHCDMASRATSIAAIKTAYSGAFELVPLTDDEAIVVEGDFWKRVASVRSELECSWFDKNHQDLQ